jgi:metal-dependent amidase/aminoacylase/carboxypeptidase family protein
VVCTLAEVEVLRAAAKEVLGSDGVIEMRHPRLAADTIHHWFAHMPGAFFMVGTASSDPATRYPSHHQRFNIAPETWEAVVAAEAMTAIRYLEKAGTAP